MITPIQRPAADPVRVKAARRELLIAAAEYATICDERRYPAMSQAVQRLKVAARRLRWAKLEIEGDPRHAPGSVADADQLRGYDRQRARSEARQLRVAPVESTK